MQSTTKPGKIKVTATVLFERTQRSISAELEIQSQSSAFPMIYNSAEAVLIPATSTEKSKIPNTKSDAFRNKKSTRKEQDTLKRKTQSPNYNYI